MNAANTRAVEEEMKIERGLILSADGEQLAKNNQQGQYYLRDYPSGDLTEPWLGYNNLRYGRAGIERVYNEELTGQTGLLGVTSSWSQILGQNKRGADLKLTIQMKVQRVAAKALGDRKGAVVALDPRTGAILAMVSYPRYDPNKLNAEWKNLIADPDRPLVNRAIQGLYPPGSVFKIIVASAGLQTGTVTPDTQFNDTGSVTLGGYEINNYGRQGLRRPPLQQGVREQHQHHLRQGRACSWAPTRWPAMPTPSASASRSPGALGGAKSIFPDPGEHGHRSGGSGLHRPGRGPLHPASHGPGGGGRGQRGHRS